MNKENKAVNKAVKQNGWGLWKRLMRAAGQIPFPMPGRGQLVYIIAILVVMASSLVIYYRVHITVIGYNIGTLKDEEASLLAMRSELKMRLAQITTQEALLERLTPESPPLPESLD